VGPGDERPGPRFLLFGGSCVGRSSVLDRDDQDTILLVQDEVDEQHPTPWPKENAIVMPASLQATADTRKRLEQLKAPLDALASVRW